MRTRRAARRVRDRARAKSPLPSNPAFRSWDQGTPPDPCSWICWPEIGVRDFTITVFLPDPRGGVQCGVDPPPHPEGWKAGRFQPPPPDLQADSEPVGKARWDLEGWGFWGGTNMGRASKPRSGNPPPAPPLPPRWVALGLRALGCPKPLKNAWKALYFRYNQSLTSLGWSPSREKLLTPSQKKWCVAVPWLVEQQWESSGGRRRRSDGERHVGQGRALRGGGGAAHRMVNRSSCWLWTIPNTMPSPVGGGTVLLWCHCPFDASGNGDVQLIISTLCTERGK